MSTSHLLSRVAALLLAFPLAACDDASGPEANGTVAVRAFAVGSAAQSGGPLNGVTSVRIDRVLLVLGRVKLEKADDLTHDYVDDRSFVVRLTPNGSGILAVDADVPAGSYKELELAFDKLELGNATETALIAANPGLANASVLIEGSLTRNGRDEPFAFATDLDMDVELEFRPPLSILDLEATTLVSLVLDVSAWLRDESGRLLDPKAASSRSAIEGNIQRSIEIFEDS